MTVFDHEAVCEDVYFAGTEREHNSGGAPIVVRDLPRCTSDELLQALGTLTLRQRYVLKLSWGLDGRTQYSFREIADAVGWHESTVREHYRAGMTRLRGAMTPAGTRSS